MASKKGEESFAGFIYYPDRLVGIPTAKFSLRDPVGSFRSFDRLMSMLVEPVFRGLMSALLSILRTRNNQYEKDMFHKGTDMSMGDYFAYRVGGRGLVDRVMSAMTHGITGGDIYKLSMASGTFADQLVPTDDQPITHVPVRAADYGMMRQMIKDKDVFDLAAQHIKSSALWFRDGFGTLPRAMADALRQNPNVTFRLGDRVENVRYHSETDKVDVSICAKLSSPHTSTDIRS
jgi:oxygen-dependent protoporphyrinogen oxidase